MTKKPWLSSYIFIGLAVATIIAALMPNYAQGQLSADVGQKELQAHVERLAAEHSALPQTGEKAGVTGTSVKCYAEPGTP